MCDIWKGNKDLKQLTEKDISGLLETFRKLGTRQVVMSGGEAMLNPNFFKLCELLQKANISVTVLSTGLTLKKNATALLQWTKEVIVSLDGDQQTHDRIRNIPNAFQKLSEGVAHIKAVDPSFRITARTVIHRLNFRNWPMIIKHALDMGLDRISFLPADVSSHAFNREILWSNERQHEILPTMEELAELSHVLDKIIEEHATEFANGFIAESPAKLKKIHSYYAAFYGLEPFPYKKCNAPWVSTVIEADGTVRPCFFHAPLGNIREESIEKILNSEKAIAFRKNLDIDADTTCRKCVCYLNLKPASSVV
jgi:MoaA/NifB/PqqE/SkfB family radical SAM enzyme